MTKLKCDDCKEKYDKIHMSVLCGECIKKEMEGVIKHTRQEERDKMLKKIEEWKKENGL